jgi:hypothetical protein
MVSLMCGLSSEEDEQTAENEVRSSKDSSIVTRVVRRCTGCAWNLARRPWRPTAVWRTLGGGNDSWRQYYAQSAHYSLQLAPSERSGSFLGFAIRGSKRSLRTDSVPTRCGGQGKRWYGLAISSWEWTDCFFSPHHNELSPDCSVTEKVWSRGQRRNQRF